MTARLPKLLIGTALAWIAVGCSTGRGGSDDTYVETDYSSLGPIVASYLPAKEGDTIDNWGMVRADGTMLFSNRFAQRPSAAVNGYFTVEEDDAIAVYAVGAAPKRVEGLSGLAHAGAMSDGLMPIARKGRRVELVDGDGVTRLELTSIDGKEIVKTSPYVVDGVLAVYTQTGHWGAVNATGEMILEPVYDDEPLFSEGIASVRRTATEKVDSATERDVTRHYLVNNRGRVIFTFPNDMKPRGLMQGGKMPVDMGRGRLALLGVDGSLVELPGRVKEVTEMTDGYMVWRDADGRAGLSEVSGGRELMAPAYRSIAVADSGRFLTEDAARLCAITDSVGSPKVRLNGFDKVEYVRRPARGVVSPFKFLGSGYAGVVMLDGHGRRQGLGPFTAIATDVLTTDDGYVHTDFFNPQASLHAIVSKLTERGWGRATIGQTMAALTDTIGISHTANRSMRLERDTLYMLALDAVVYSDRPVARDSVGEEGKHIYRPDTDARVKYIRVEAAVPGARYGAMVEHLGSELVPRGFRAEKLRDEYAVYACGDIYVVVTPRPKLQGLYLYVMDKAFYDEAAAKIIADGEKTYRQTVNPS